MVYETYETDAFVLSAHNAGEGNRIFNLLTKDFGLVKGAAQNVRAETSKLRYHLQVFSKTNVSLVRGREYFRIVGAKDALQLHLSFRGNQEKIVMLRRIFNLLLRLIHGEGVNEYLFSAVDSCVDVLKITEFPARTLKQLEILTVARILYSLGYFVDKAEYRFLFENTLFSEEILAYAGKHEREVLSDINKSLRESHL